MPTAYLQNGKAFLRNGVPVLGDCCCEECAIVEVNLYVSSFSDPTDASTGSGMHSSVVELYAAVCAAVASCSGTTWAQFGACSDSRSCYATNGCGRILSRARLTSGDDMTLRAPWMGGGASETPVGYLKFQSTRVVKAGKSITVNWAGSIKYYSASGGAPTARTRKPRVRVLLSTGAQYSASGADTTFSWSNTAGAGGTLQDFTATAYLQ